MSHFMLEINFGLLLEGDSGLNLDKRRKLGKVLNGSQVDEIAYVDD